MRFKQYLTEGRRSKVISEDESIDILQKNCKNTVRSYLNDKSSRIYRGLGREDHYQLFIDPKKFTRVSKNTSNYYTLLIDNSPYWKAYPKRSQSIICTNKESGTGGYGNIYIVIPYDGSKVGVCPSFDFWDSFKQLGKITSLDDFNDNLESIMKRSNIMFSDRNYNEIKSAFDTLTLFINDQPDGVEKLDTYGSYTGITWLKNYKGQDFMEFINKLLDPKRNDFKLTMAGQGLGSRKAEVWTDSKSVLLSIDVPSHVEITERILNAV